MGKTTKLVGVAALAAAMAIGSGAAAAPLSLIRVAEKGHAGDSGKACFYARNLSSWTAVSRSVVNLRVNVSDYYQLTLLGDCPNIDWTQHIGIEHQGSDWICSGLDATLIVPQGTGGPPLRCAVQSLRKLSPEEAKALPRKQKP